MPSKCTLFFAALVGLYTLQRIGAGVLLNQHNDEAITRSLSVS